MRVVYICATMALGLILGLPSSRATAQEANTRAAAVYSDADGPAAVA